MIDTGGQSECSSQPSCQVDNARNCRGCEISIMKDKPKSIGMLLIGLVIMAVLMLVCTLLILGAGWVTDKLLPWFSMASTIAFAVLVVVLLPLSAMRPTRSFAASSILYVSYLFGVTAWIEGLIVTL